MDAFQLVSGNTLRCFRGLWKIMQGHFNNNVVGVGGETRNQVLP